MEVVKKVFGFIGRLIKGGWALPILAGLFMFFFMFSRSGGFVEIEPGEVAVKYNQTGLAMFGDEKPTVIKEQGVIGFMPFFQRVEKLDAQPQIFQMEGVTNDKDNRNHVKRLTVRANDGSEFYFDRLEIHYQLIPSAAGEVIRNNGKGDDYKWRAIRVHSREVLRDVFGKHSFLEIADPSTYGEATNRAKQALNARLEPLGLQVTNIPPPKPKFDERVEKAIEDRQNAEQEVEVQEEKRNKLEQEKNLRLQQVEQQKNAEYQQLLGELEARKQQANNNLIASKREADKYYIEREAAAIAQRDEKVTRAKANEVAYRKEAEALVAKINAVGEEGPDVLNRVIAEKVFPQLSKVRAVPYTRPSTPIDIRHIDRPGGAP